MITSKQIRRQAKELFRLCLVDGALDQQRVRGVVSGLAGRKPHGFIPLLKAFYRRVKLETERRTAMVESAVDLDDSQKSSLTEKLVRLYGRGLEIQYRQNAELLGGLRIKVGSDVLDGSLHARLNELRKNF